MPQQGSEAGKFDATWRASPTDHGVEAQLEEGTDHQQVEQRKLYGRLVRYPRNLYYRRRCGAATNSVVFGMHLLERSCLAVSCTYVSNEACPLRPRKRRNCSQE